MRIKDEQNDFGGKQQIIRHFDTPSERPDISMLPNEFFTALSSLSLASEINFKDIIKCFDYYLNPNVFETYINESIYKAGLQTYMCGTVEDRIAIIKTDKEIYFAFSFGSSFDKILTPELIKLLGISEPSCNFSNAELNSHFWSRINSEKIMLFALYHPETFPLPRFPLGISDIAYAIRKYRLGKVYLRDMQLGISKRDIIDEIEIIKPKVIGISTTFGQNDILEELISKLKKLSLEEQPVFVFGGTLAALNANYILQEMPHAFVGLGPGEKMILDVYDYIHGLKDKEHICGIAYIDSNGEIVRNKNQNNRDSLEIIPELDLLPSILDKSGVMQLESSRGCSYSCSFCPRSHKGIWAGDDYNSFRGILPFISREFNLRPLIAKKIFLVDEEYFGYHPLSDQRARDVAKELLKYGFKFETSSRIDQVFRPQKSISWHINRIDTWREIACRNLSRCLFGVESGVDSILNRFNKKITSNQNIVAIRILSLMSIPTRFTYIMFDPLMTMDELIESYNFIGRKDLLIQSQIELLPEKIYQYAQNDDYAVKKSLGKPFYYEISYMLVSMECLLGSKYTQHVESLGLIKKYNPQMGRANVAYLHPVIGLFSNYCQLWIDRNFSLDYLLKSLQKISENDTSNLINKIRVTLKKYAYHLLGDMINLENSVLIAQDFAIYSYKDTVELKNKWKEGSLNDKEIILQSILDRYFTNLKIEIKHMVDEINISLPASSSERLNNEIHIWEKLTDWSLINE